MTRRSEKKTRPTGIGLGLSPETWRSRAIGRYVRGRLCISPDVNFTVFKAMIDVSPLTRMIDKKRATRSNHDSSRVPRRRLAFRRARGGFGFAAAALVSAKTSRGVPKDYRRRTRRLRFVRTSVLEGVHSHPSHVRTPSTRRPRS